ncbi:hypothetical protein GCM10020000_12110 [Streptomyces olivoverticillatus]
MGAPSKARLNVRTIADRRVNRPSSAGRRRNTVSTDDIAVIGLALRLPGAGTLEELFRHLVDGRSLISEVPPERWSKERYFGDPRRGAEKTSSIWGGFIEDADCFDASFFAISPREAESMDPQQRFALELAWKAVEDAGYRASELAGTKTGVFMGVCHADYAELMEREGVRTDVYFPTGTAYSIIANRVSYFFDFQGPSITNDTACSSSLVSVYEAVTALQNGECGLALAGGVNLCWSPKHFVAFSQASMLSRTGTCRAFDQGADGYVRGEGGAVLLLKPLAKALEDGDPVHAVIKGIATNHGGRTSSLTVTNPAAQASLVEGLYTRAGIRPETVTYIEAHGPGTPVGDPIEVVALKRAFSGLHAAQGTEPEPSSCGIGSVKTNIGHLEGAAGVAGMAKVIGALATGVLPATVNFEKQNKLIKLDGSPFHIVRDTRPWAEPPAGADGQPAPRRAGVSSFGFGGTNAHVVLEEHRHEAEAETKADGDSGPQLVPPLRQEPRQAARPRPRAPRPPPPAGAGRRRRGLAAAAAVARRRRLHPAGRPGADARARRVRRRRNAGTRHGAGGVRGRLPRRVGRASGRRCDVRRGDRAAGDLRGLGPRRGGRLVRAAREHRAGAPAPRTAAHVSVRARAPLVHRPRARPARGAGARRRRAPPARPPQHLRPRRAALQLGLHRGRALPRLAPGARPTCAARSRLPGDGACGGALRHGRRGADGSVLRLRDVAWMRPLVADGTPADVHVGLAPREDGTLAFEVYTGPAALDPSAVVHSRGAAEVSPQEPPSQARPRRAARRVPHGVRTRRGVRRLPRPGPGVRAGHERTRRDAPGVGRAPGAHRTARRGDGPGRRRGAAPEPARRRLPGLGGPDGEDGARARPGPGAAVRARTARRVRPVHGRDVGLGAAR